MDLSLFEMAGVSIGVTLGSKLFEKLWKKNRESVTTTLNGIDETIELKTGYQWPLELHQTYDRLVKRIVASIDYVSNPVIFRRIERAILALGNPATRAVLLHEYWDVISGKAKETITEELKTIINTEKETVAVEAVAADASVSLPPEFVATRDIKADVKAAVVAQKQLGTKTVTTEEINARVETSRAKLAAFVNRGK